MEYWQTLYFNYFNFGQLKICDVSYKLVDPICVEYQDQSFSDDRKSRSAVSKMKVPQAQ